MSTELMSRFSILASLFKYPGAEFKGILSDAAELFSGVSEKESFHSFRVAVETMTAEELEELYTRTFDLNPVCTLEIGWQLYGDDYKRGDFLVKMRQLLREYEIAEDTELPDHLTYMLMALDRTETDSGKEFGDKFVRPALKKMMEGFKDKSNPYFSLLRFLDTELAQYVDLERKAES